MHRALIIMALLSWLISCGPAVERKGPTPSPTATPVPSDECRTDDSGVMLKIVCTYYIKVGTDFEMHSLVFYVPKPLNGNNGIGGIDGQDGQDGQDGKDGKDGQNGTSCTVSRTANGALIACTDGTFAVVLDGMNTGIPVNSVIDPCGPQSAYDEVLLRMDNHQVIAYLIGPGSAQARLAVLPPGNYVTSDGTNCYFTVHADGNITY